MSSQLQHRRTHNLLLFSKLLNGRDNGSPFTLVLDSLEQSSKPLVREMIKRAKASKTKIIYVSFETLRQPKDSDVFIVANESTPPALQKEILSSIDSSRKNLLIFDTLHPLLHQPNISIASYLSSFPSSYTSLLAVYHSDIPLVPNTSFYQSYQPPPQTLLTYLATSILTVHSFSHVLARKAATDRSLAFPVFGLQEDIEGVMVGLGSNDPRDVVVEMEYRRKSGRVVREWFFMGTAQDSVATKEVPARASRSVILLEDHPLHSSSAGPETTTRARDEGLNTTFNLSLTAKQLKDREGVVLPYFDAQSGAGPGEGGRILYDIGVEDDFDDEEDEI